MKPRTVNKTLVEASTQPGNGVSNFRAGCVSSPSADRSSGVVDSASANWLSPVRLVSPHAPSGVNLTGLPRRLRDGCADVYNACRRWDQARLRGARIIARIAALRSTSAAAEVDDNDELRLCALCDELLSTLDELSKAVALIASVGAQFRALVSIEDLQRSRRRRRSSAAAIGAASRIERSDELNDADPEVPFITYSVRRFSAAVAAVEAAYSAELDFKRRLAKRVAFQNRRCHFTFANVCWTYDAAVDEQVVRNVLALVAECGFK